MRVIWNCALQSWQIGIGDPGVMGWVVVACYLLAAAMTLAVAMRGRFGDGTAGRERFFWIVLSLMLVALAVNKQLDLQSLLTAGARCAARLQGWYQDRRIVQIGFIVILLATMLLVALIIWNILRGTLRRTGLALLGLIIVLAFVGIRAVGFHGMDRLINLTVYDIRFNWVMELAGPIFILASCIMNLRAARQ